ncbi:MAG: pyridoxal phosphate-dependent aminotransferase [Clostridiaceae bacterium]
MNYSKKLLAITPSLTLQISAQAKKMKEEGKKVISFGAGEPDFNTPLNIQKAAIKAMEDGYTKYTPASGILPLKKAIVKKLKNDNNLDYTTTQIIISNGAKQCVANTLMAILNEGDEVIIPAPYWVTYPELVKIADGVPIFIETKESNEFKITKESLEKAITSKTKAIILNSPNNPTGSLYSKEELQFIADIAKQYDFIIISDEIYEKLIYGDEKHISIASLSEDAYNRTIVINGVSKSYAMTGWRVGYCAGPEAVIKLMNSLQSHATSNANSIAQYASIEALEGDQSTVYMMKDEFKKRRNFMFNRINQTQNISCISPKGAFYILVNISELLGKSYNGLAIKDSVDFSNILLENGNVAVVPGDAFGIAGYIRMSYATSMENIKNGLDNMEDFIKHII